MDNTVVAFDMDRCHMELNYPYALLTLSLTKLKKVFEIMCKQGYRNTEAISTTDSYLEALIAEAKEEWHKASVEYQNGYKDTTFYGLSATQKATYKKNNDKLLRVVVSKKKAYERMLKVSQNFADIKAKYHI